MRGVAGQWALEVKVNGQDLGLDSSNTPSFQIISNIHQRLPSFSFAHDDKVGKYSDASFNDGDSVSISIGIPDDLYSGMGFRMMGPPDLRPSGNKNILKASGVLDNIGWMQKLVDRNYKGTSSDVIRQIASAAGLEAEVDATNDFMNWLPTRTSLVQYARHVAERSFSSATSSMLLATTDTGKVKYKDLDKLISSGSKATLSSFGDGFPILDWAATPKSKVTNSAQGYGATSIGINEDGSVFEGNKIQMTMMSAASSISSAFQSAIGDAGSRVLALAPLSGNTHENWYKALHQNPRIKASYAYDVSVLTNKPTRLELLDTVDISPMNYATGKEAKAVSGKYIVTAITKTIIQNRFFEKIVVTAQGEGGVG